MSGMMLLISLALISLGWFWGDVGRGILASEKAQTMADVSVLSSFRMRGEALRLISERWWDYGASFGEPGTTPRVFLPSVEWERVERKAGDLKRALPGYEGRITSVIKVVHDANGAQGTTLNTIDPSASRLGVVAEPLVIEDENGNQKTIQGGWFRRLWSTPHPSGNSQHVVRGSLSVRQGVNWIFQQAALGELVWDVDENDLAIKNHGNGGFPLSWKEAVLGKSLQPHRYPYYRAKLKKDSHEI
ncbi:MAG: hypothetical protein KCHDKBKB_01749 [Elusimicrobia bacterium]|nr:hypothetical protein [Elusimicrobiota bacterium]